MTKEQLREYVQRWFNCYDTEWGGDADGDSSKALSEVLACLADEPTQSRKHPVDALKEYAEAVGIEMSPQAEAEMRAICDEPVCIACGRSVKSSAEPECKWVLRNSEWVNDCRKCGPRPQSSVNRDAP